MTALPKILVAPTGARRGKSDHPALPVTIEEIIETCRACASAGAGGVHAHIRADDGSHSLDLERYRTLVARLEENFPGWFVQVTSEAAGRYDAAEQRTLIRSLKPKAVTAAIRELVPDAAAEPDAKVLYHWARDNDVTIQHICFDLKDMERLIGFIRDGTIPGSSHQVQLVLGSYDGSKVSRPEDIEPFIEPMLALGQTQNFDWMLCAFGREETDCLLRTLELGGKARIGFENSLWNRDGSVARDNAERVEELVSLARASGLKV
ncbi:3-keto-5-aminohexanoate cleavage protein [Roseibium sp. MMSF_3412]|uniref:3-keto-5-aminohexanoate cleavage protein n=1 Tax=Roseibium sp. MMSF_3412 TaxID=3046712 RepID=UPI00273D66BB|nr:3-keto-5-aminohexanoate cleavage protein [Roseibium sp. MMSF_3412]